MQDVLHGPVGEEFPGVVVVRVEGFGRQEGGFVQEAVDLFPAGEVFHCPIGDDGGFAVSVEGYQLCNQLFLCLLPIHP